MRDKRDRSFPARRHGFFYLLSHRRPYLFIAAKERAAVGRNADKAVSAHFVMPKGRQRRLFDELSPPERGYFGTGKIIVIAHDREKGGHFLPERLLYRRAKARVSRLRGDVADVARKDEHVGRKRRKAAAGAAQIALESVVLLPKKGRKLAVAHDGDAKILPDFLPRSSFKPHINISVGAFFFIAILT